MTPTPDPRELLKGTTPGPWSIFPDERTAIVSQQGRQVASVIGYKRETDADARLIAAAPDLARRLAEAEAWLDKLGRRDYVKCGWDNLGKEGYCRPGFCEHGSCEEALEIKALLAREKETRP